MFCSFDLLVAFILNLPIAYISLKKKALTKNAVITAFILGLVVAGFGGLLCFLVLLTFYFTSTILTKYKKKEKAFIVEDKFQKSGQRSVSQVLANGLVAMMMIVLDSFYCADLFLIAFAGAVAATTADTWATEIGVLSKKKPVMITTFKSVEPGTSGAVSKIGTTAAFLGSLLIASITFSFMHLGLLALLAIAIGGFLGAIADSLMGATIQAVYYCDYCKKETEKKIHRCGSKTRQIRGIRFINNDYVNLLSSLFGAILSMIIYSFVCF